MTPRPAAAPRRRASGPSSAPDAMAPDESRRRGAHVLAAVGAGTVIPVQARLNGELSDRLDDGIAAAAISFAVGLLLMTVVVLCSPALRRSLKTLVTAARGGALPRRYLLAGVLGGTFALAQSTSALVTGIAVFTVSAIAGQTVSGLLVDARGVGGGPRQQPNAARVAAAAVILVAAAVSVLPQLTDTPRPATVVLPALGAIAAGFLLGVQQALNGATSAASGSPLAATWLNFLVGSFFLATAWGATAVARGLPGRSLPDDPWVYLGGLCGVAFIGASAHLVRRLGVLVLTMALIAGQLVGSLTLDFAVPAGDDGPSLLTILAALLTFAAVAIAARRSARQ